MSSESLATNGQSLSRDSESYVSLNSYERKPGLMTFGGSDKCYRCLKNVYAAEKVIFIKLDLTFFINSKKMFFCFLKVIAAGKVTKSLIINIFF